MTKHVVVLGGEGIGPEVVDATCEILVASGMPVEILTPPHGAAFGVLEAYCSP